MKLETFLFYNIKYWKIGEQVEMVYTDDECKWTTYGTLVWIILYAGEWQKSFSGKTKRRNRLASKTDEINVLAALSLVVVHLNELVFFYMYEEKSAF